MRIVAGDLRGRRLVVPKDARVRPTADRVREAWMSILGGELEGARVHRGDALRFAERLESGAFDLAFADPPYVHDAAARLVALFRRAPFARILSVEHRADQRVEGDETRRYGDTALTFCRRP